MIEGLDIATIVAQLGFAAVFFYLYTRERQDRAEAQKELVMTLREIAGLRQQLARTENYVAGFHARERTTSDTQQIPKIE